MINNCLNPKCKHDWFQRNDQKSKQCPKCKSYYWDDEEHWKDKTQLNQGGI